MQDEALSGSDKRQWDGFIDKLGTKDLESALQAIKLSEKLSDHVVEQTWNLISAADASVFEKVLSDVNLLPLTRAVVWNSGFLDRLYGEAAFSVLSSGFSHST